MRHGTQPESAPAIERHDRDGVAWITMTRPDAYNALSNDLIAALLDSLNDIAGDPTVKAVIISGAGKGFCAGHDLKEMRTNRSESFYKALFEHCSTLMQAIITLPQPVIARVHGIATAAGCQLVATCDLAIASDNARFATPGVNIGLFCSTPMVAVSRKVPRKKMMEMLLTGDMIDAATAVDYGLINRAVPPADLDQAVSELAAKIVAKSPLVLKIGKEAFYRQIEMPLADAYAYTGTVMTRNMLARDAEEGISAFIEKRPPVWKGE